MTRVTQILIYDYARGMPFLSNIYVNEDNLEMLVTLSTASGIEEDHI